MTNGDIVREVALWMEGRWAEDLSVPALAARAGYSLHHFSRLFAGVVGMAPGEYVLRRRLSEAARELAAGRRRVTDVAFDYGFNDLETFTRAFRRVFGRTPSAARRGVAVTYFEGVRAGLSPSPVASSAPPALEKSPAFLIAGWNVRVTGETGEVGKLWARFAGRAPSIRRRARPLAFRQLATWTEDAEDWIDILVGAEMETLDELELDLSGKAVPACDCLAFEHRGSAARVAESYRAIYADLLPAMDRKPSLPFNFETYYPDAGDPYSDSYRFRICVPLA